MPGDISKCEETLNAGDPTALLFIYMLYSIYSMKIMYSYTI